MIGDRIKELRIRNGLTQVDLARRLQLTRSSINAWEMGISIPSTQYIVELASLFKVSSDYILEITSDETIDISHLSEEEKALMMQMLRYFSVHQLTLDLLKKYNITPAEEDLESVNASLIAHFNKDKEPGKKKKIHT